MEANDRQPNVTLVHYGIIAIRLLVGVVGVALAFVVVWQSARLVFRDDPRNALRQGDELLISGRYHDALAIYTEQTTHYPDFAAAWARRSMIETLRGEPEPADYSMGMALQLGLRGNDHDLARLYQGYLANNAGRNGEAASAWATIGADSPLSPFKHVLEAEQLLHAGDYAGAEIQFHTVAENQLPDEWRALVRTRLAALRAASDPDAALAMLTIGDQTAHNTHWWSRITAQASPITYQTAPSSALVAPLLPTAAPSASALLQALRADPDQRPQLLGQLYLDSGLYPLAEAQFKLASLDSRRAHDAAAYAAYTRWRAGDRATGVQQLETLVAANPSDARARALLAVTYVASDDAARAKTQLDAIRALAPRDPDTHLAWAQWYAAQHDYLAAADAYQRALNDAPVEQRGTYALALARFSLDTDVQPCEFGAQAAEESAQRLASDAQTWTALAGIRYRCGDSAGARVAAQMALAHNPDAPEASYYLGRALADLGDRSGARAALVSAADLAPASAWRERAEKQIAVLGL